MLLSSGAALSGSFYWSLISDRWWITAANNDVVANEREKERKLGRSKMAAKRGENCSEALRVYVCVCAYVRVRVWSWNGRGATRDRERKEEGWRVKAAARGREKRCLPYLTDRCRKVWKAQRWQRALEKSNPVRGERAESACRKKRKREVEKSWKRR